MINHLFDITAVSIGVVVLSMAYVITTYKVKRSLG